MSNTQSTLPLVLAGPIVRHVSKDSFTLWMVTSECLNQQFVELDSTLSPIQPLFFNENKCEINLHKNSVEISHFKLGDKCFIYHLLVEQDGLFTPNSVIYYDAVLILENGSNKQLSDALPSQLHEDEPYFSVRVASDLRYVIHGSCRKPHYDKGVDALPQLDNLIKGSLRIEDEIIRPDLMILSGDQVYADDVAGPMLYAIHQVINLLGLFHETFEGGKINDSKELLVHEASFYERESLLPKSKENKNLNKSFFKGKRKPIFTSVNAANHLISLNEMVALYLLSWSSRLWPFVTLEKPDLKQKYKQQYDLERSALQQFIEGIPKVERAFSHIATYMIFDDHDITDDWNLTRAWEEEVYTNTFSNRIVGNALVAYFLFQGIGNPKSTWQHHIKKASKCFSDNFAQLHEEFIQHLYKAESWHYNLDTYPKIHVLDTRTQRWRSESDENKPSGLMDWENLCELQQNLIGEESVIMVSPSPIYGVKFIEAVQKIFTFFGGALMVDAENWMAHKGTASVMLNIFTHVKTPPHFIILSGDVHYSFVYDVSLRFRRNSPKIVQFTCSGIHNEFPKKLITWFERINRYFYGHRSPLNWLTKRRNMSIKERSALYPAGYQQSNGSGIGDKKDIVNGTCLGLLCIDDNGQEAQCKVILADGNIVTFKK